MIDKNTPVGSEMWQADYQDFDVQGPFLMVEHLGNISKVASSGLTKPDGSPILFMQVSDNLFPSKREAVQDLIDYLQNEINRLGKLL